LEEAKRKIEQLRQHESSEEESAIPNLTGMANQTTINAPTYFDSRGQQGFTEEDFLQFASNGTSFDDYARQRIHDLNKTGELAFYSAMEKMSANQSALTKGATVCMSPLGAFICDYTLSLMYEFCQIIPNPNQFIVCASPTIANYLAEKNIPEDKRTG
jgi:hypothetical protein